MGALSPAKEIVLLSYGTFEVSGLLRTHWLREPAVGRGGHVVPIYP